MLGGRISVLQGFGGRFGPMLAQIGRLGQTPSKTEPCMRFAKVARAFRPNMGPHGWPIGTMANARVGHVARVLGPCCADSGQYAPKLVQHDRRAHLTRKLAPFWTDLGQHRPHFGATWSQNAPSTRATTSPHCPYLEKPAPLCAPSYKLAHFQLWAEEAHRPYTAGAAYDVFCEIDGLRRRRRTLPRPISRSFGPLGRPSWKIMGPF